MRIEPFLRDLQSSPTPHHVVDNLRRRLLEAGYTPMPRSAQALRRGGHYFTVAHSRALVAFRLDAEDPTGLMLTASHADSPCFHLRDRAECVGGDCVRLSAEPYGGMIRDSWLDRPLSIAGQVIVRTDRGVEKRLVDFRRAMAIIPRMAIHINREVNKGYAYDPARDLVPLYGGGDSVGAFRQELSAEIGCEEEDILSSDLILYNNQPGVVWGPKREFLSSPRLDDLACVFTCVRGFLEAAPSRAIPVFCVFDNEEIGSGTKQGAAATLLPDTLGAIADFLGRDLGELLESSLMLSCDNGHARHPNHPETADPTQYALMGGGVMVKHSPRYATDALSSALFMEICRRAGVPTQHYSNRPDQVGGGTLGDIANTKVSVNTVDIGMPQLAMHSCFETTGTQDVLTFAQAMKVFYGSALQAQGNTVHIL